MLHHIRTREGSKAARHAHRVIVGFSDPYAQAADRLRPQWREGRRDGRYRGISGTQTTRISDTAMGGANRGGGGWRAWLAREILILILAPPLFLMLMMLIYFVGALIGGRGGW